MSNESMPRVGIDAQLTIGTPTGIGVYITGLHAGLAQLGCTPRMYQSELLNPWRFDRRVIWDQVALPVRLSDIDVLHCPGGTMPLLSAVPIVVNVHDMAWQHMQQHAPWYARAYFGRMMPMLYPRAAHVITGSYFARDEFLQYVTYPPERVHVIDNGVDLDYAQVTRRPEYEKPLLLAIGTIEKRKNVRILIEALAQLRDRSVRLAIPGPDTPYRAECESRAVELGVNERIDWLGYVSREAVLQLYETATIALVPSRYEGFGYGVAQALVAGVPLVIAATSSLPEIAGPGVKALDPDDAPAWADAIDELLEQRVQAEQDAAARRNAAITRFSWASAAQATLDVYHLCV